MGEEVKRRRGELRLGQKDLLARMDPPLGIETVRRVEAGDQRNYRLTTLAAVSVALDWPPDALERIAYGEDPPAGASRLDNLEARLADVELKVDEILVLLEDGSPE